MTWARVTRTQFTRFKGVLNAILLPIEKFDHKLRIIRRIVPVQSKYYGSISFEVENLSSLLCMR